MGGGRMESSAKVPRSFVIASSWIATLLTGWVSFVAGSGWVAAAMVAPVGIAVDAMQRLNGIVGRLANAALVMMLALVFIVPVAATFLPATRRFENHPSSVRRAIVSAWAVWVFLGLVGWGLFFAGTESTTVGFVLVEAVVPMAVGLLILTVFSIAATAWRARAGHSRAEHT